MFSGDGEYVDFLHPVLLEGPVEVSSGEGLRAKLILLPFEKCAWLCEGRAPPQRDPPTVAEPPPCLLMLKSRLSAPLPPLPSGT